MSSAAGANFLHRTPLPNPFSAPNLDGYDLASTRMRMRFDITERYAL
ncbi:hypothetical protein [Streptomyces sp. NPDC001340]